MIIVVIAIVFLILSGIDRRSDDLVDPEIQGYVFSKEAESFLVAKGLEGGLPYNGDINRLKGEAILFQVTGDTEFEDSLGEKISYADIQLYDEVFVWSEGGILESYPAQTTAKKVALTGSKFVEEKEDEPSVLACDHNNSVRLNVIVRMVQNWLEIEKNLPQRPTLGSTVWHTPYHAQFIGESTVLIAFEDGHKVMTSVIGFDCVEGQPRNFRVLKTDALSAFPLEESVWNGLRASYGSTVRRPNTYTSIPVFAQGEMINVSDWTEIGYNIFILDLGQGQKL